MLTSVSPVFAAMFNGTNMVEETSGVIKFADFDITVVHIFVEFLYGRDLKDVTDWKYRLDAFSYKANPVAFRFHLHHFDVD